MANIKSSKKRAKTNLKKSKKNVKRYSEVKSETKKVLDSIKNNDLEIAKKNLRKTESKIARAKGKGLFKKNTAIRKIKKLAKKVAKALKLSNK